MATKTSKKRISKKTASKKKMMLINWLIVFGVSALIAIPIVINSFSRSNLPGEGFSSQGNAHISSVDADHPAYNSQPASSGWHVGNLGNWGSYDYVVPEELFLHNLEDGGVILYYKYGTPEENEIELSKLEAVARGYQKIVIAPYEGLETPYTLVAWQRLQAFDDINENEMRNFLEAFEGVDHH